VVNWPRRREILSRGGNLYTRLALGVPYRDATGGYRASAGVSDPLELLRTVRRARGRAAVADARRVIPPAKRIAPVVRTEAHAPETVAPPIWEWPDSMSAIPRVEDTQDGESVSQPPITDTPKPAPPAAAVEARA